MPNSEELSKAFNPDDQREAYQTEIDKITEQISELNEKNINASRFQLFDELGDKIHKINIEKGFWGDPEEMDKWVAKLMLIVSEVSEVMEALRKSEGSDKVTEEFADILIRLFDLYAVLVRAGEADPNLYTVMTDKLKKNKARSVKHGNRWG